MKSYARKRVFSTIETCAALSTSYQSNNEWSPNMSIGMILLIILILILLGVIPSWPHSRSWGYAPGGMVGLLLVILIVMLLLGYI
jgi:hypothetical protein